MPFALLLVLLLSACAGTGGSAAAPPSAAALLDAYLIAHGMAASYAQSPGADPAVVVRLATLDLRARDALLAFGTGDASGDRAASALAEFTAGEAGLSR